MRALKIIKTYLLSGLADWLSLKLLELLNGQPSANNTIKLIGKDAQREQKRLYDGSYNDITDIWHSKKLCF